ncbi:MAG: ABC transporter ATP-binding protein [Acholeplasmatales bacterium]|nr:ABC transporter ATP-binding protein [Acholeplasmatales bacterium]
MAFKIEIKNLYFDYLSSKKKIFPALENINLNIEEGKFVCILGASGCGKSTLLSILSGLNKAKSGEVLIDNKKIEGPGIDRAVVFQHYSLFPFLTVKGNVLFGIKQAKKKYKRKEREALVKKYLKNVGLLDAQNKYPNELSGGMQQRVAVARALALESDILLMDEPFGAIDPRLRLELQELVSKLSKDNNKTVVFVTHDIDEALLLADTIVVMEPSKIKEVLNIDFEFPRIREELVSTPKYQELYKKLFSLFYNIVLNEIHEEAML